jgi:hypothetical protein
VVIQEKRRQLLYSEGRKCLLVNDINASLVMQEKENATEIQYIMLLWWNERYGYKKAAAVVQKKRLLWSYKITKGLLW